MRAALGSATALSVGAVPLRSFGAFRPESAITITMSRAIPLRTRACVPRGSSPGGLLALSRTGGAEYGTGSVGGMALVLPRERQLPLPNRQVALVEDLVHDVDAVLV